MYLILTFWSQNIAYALRYALSELPGRENSIVAALERRLGGRSFRAKPAFKDAEPDFNRT